MTFTLGEQQKILMGTLKENGVSLVGFGDVSIVKLELTEKFPVAISLAVKYSEIVVENLHTNEEAFHKHDIELEAFMKQLINIVENLLSKWDYQYTIIPTSILIKDDRQLRELKVFPSKTAATCAGLGWIGKNALLVTPQYGPRIKLGTILTNARFEVGEAIIKDQCGECNLCVEACPYGAIHNVNWRQGIGSEALFDAYLCNQMRLNHIPILGRKYECAMCIQACKVGKN